MRIQKDGFTVLKNLFVVLLIILPLGSTAQTTDQVYRIPPPGIADIVDAEPTPGVSVDPTKRWMLLIGRSGLPTIAELSQPELRIAGIRINPANNGVSRASYSDSLRLQDLSNGNVRPISGLPDAPRIGTTSWSPNGEHIAFVLDRETRIELWIADTDTAVARKLINANVNDIFGQSFEWFSDSEKLLVKTIPASRPAAPVERRVPAGPVIQESSGVAAAAPTFQDLLTDGHDEDLFQYYGTSQLVIASLNGSTTDVEQPALIRRASISPDRNFILAEIIQRPFSYLVPHSRFSRRIEIWDSQLGAVMKLLADLPLAEAVPLGREAVPAGPRSFAWRTDADATLYWVEARDGGDPRADAAIRDVLLTLPAPFTGEPQELLALSLRFEDATWGNSGLALITESWWTTRQTRTWRLAPDEPGATADLLFEYSSEDRYSDPGTPVLTQNTFGKSSLLFGEDGKSIYLAGQGASDEGDRPFLDRLDLTTQTSERLWQSEAPYYSSFVSFLDDTQDSLLIRRESPAEPANYFRLENRTSSQLTPLTNFPHPYPQLANVYKEVVRYQRNDGVMLTATLYLPPGAGPDDGPFPMLMWAYPTEFKDADSASQVQGSPYRFNAIGVNGPLPFLASGYAIFDGPTMPIVGEGELEPNDAFVNQLVASAEAAVDEVVRRGVAERDRIAIGGHSYGAFMTANLLAHSDLFIAGLARSGAYNRTLTPFGFQAEERTYWEAPDVYFQMSPFMYANMISEPLLMIHGEADNNTGTFPLQSERFYNALKGHGVKTRLVMLPHESHGYQARESVMHTLWEMNSWMNRYVKGE